MKSRKGYTQEQEEWLKENYNKYNYKELTQKFNKHFNESRTPIAIRGVINKNKWCKQSYYWSPEELNFIKQYFGSISDQDFYKNYCKIFGNKRSVIALRDKAQLLGVYKGKEYIKKVRFQVVADKYPIGHIRDNGHNLYIKIKNEKVNYALDNYISLVEYTLQQNNITLKPHQCIKFKDGNYRNCNIDNIIVLSHSTRAYISLNHLWNKGEITETALKIGELNDLLRNKEE